MIKLKNIIVEKSNTYQKMSIPIESGVASGNYIISTWNNTIRFIPNIDTLDKLRGVSDAEIRDELQAYCESKTGLKFSRAIKDEGAGYAFVIDMYSILAQIRN